MSLDQRMTVRRVLSWVLVVALCVAALTAIVAIAGGDFDETDGRVIATSLGFAVFSATAASGASLRFRESTRLRTLGSATIGLSAAAFLLLLVGLWSEGDDGVWRWFGSAALAALACSHMSLVSQAKRGTDSLTVRAVGTVSMVLAGVDSLVGVLAVSGAVDEVDDSFGQGMAALVVLLLLTTALPPILRRVQRPAQTPALELGGRAGAAPPAGSASTGPPAAHPSGRPSAPLPLAVAVLGVADRIEALNADPGNRASEIHRECERLRDLARSYSR
jgi:hypothetical protein